MQKIDKDYSKLLSAKYKEWVEKLDSESKIHPKSSSYYYDVVMELYRIQKGVCAYTEMHICIPEVCNPAMWTNGKYKVPDEAIFKRTDHFGELEHFDPSLKGDKYWRWDNLFMIHSTINSRKSNRKVIPYVKPDLDDYSPEKYFDYDDNTHRFIPNTDITDTDKIKEIQYMIDNVLFLNHGVVLNERRNFINNIRFNKEYGLTYTIDRFFTTVKWCT